MILILTEHNFFYAFKIPFFAQIMLNIKNYRNEVNESRANSIRLQQQIEKKFNVTNKLNDNKAPVEDTTSKFPSCEETLITKM
jgi:hypothetical protein